MLIYFVFSYIYFVYFLYCVEHKIVINVYKYIYYFSCNYVDKRVFGAKIDFKFVQIMVSK